MKAPLDAECAAIDFLVARCTRDLPSRTINGMPVKPQVIDGPPLVNLAKDGVTIGWSPDELAVTATVEPGGLADNLQSFDIHCTAWSRTGADKAGSKVARDNVKALLASIGQILTNDPRLGGAVTSARLRVVDLDQMHNKDGTWAVSAFAVACKAFT